MNGNHVRYMLLGGAGVVGVLTLVGVPLSSALLYGILLACPLMMIMMPGHGGHGGGHHHSSRGDDHPHESSGKPRQHQPRP